MGILELKCFVCFKDFGVLSDMDFFFELASRVVKILWQMNSKKIFINYFQFPNFSFPRIMLLDTRKWQNKIQKPFSPLSSSKLWKNIRISSQKSLLIQTAHPNITFPLKSQLKTIIFRTYDCFIPDDDDVFHY